MHSPSFGSKAPDELPARTAIVIIGGGIVGVATAMFLRRSGLESIILEAENDIGQRTTAMSAHCIRAQFGEPDNIRMMSESLDFYERFAEFCDLPSGSDPIGLRQQGYLFASTNPADTSSFAERVRQQRNAGLEDVELLAGDEVRNRYPWISPDVAVATFRNRDGWIDSARAIRHMAAWARIPIYCGVRVEEIVVRNDRVTGVFTSAGRIATGTVVLATGPFAPELSPEPLPVSLLRRNRVIVSPQAEIPQDGPVTIDANTGAHWRPHRGGALLAWARPELSARPMWPVAPDPAFTDVILRGDDGVARLAPFWRDIAATLDPAHITLTAGQYTVTPDHRPLIGPAPLTSGLFLHTGYSGHGIMGAPSGARLLAEIIASSADVPNPFSPDRFAGNVAPPDVEQVII